MPDAAQPLEPLPWTHLGVPLREGQLTSGWRTLLISGWMAVLAALGAVWQAGRYVGISPWWVGPETNPRSMFVTLAPFALGLLTLILAIRNHRWALWIGMCASFASIGIARVDLNRYRGLGLAQIAIGAAALALTTACLAGRVRGPERAPRARDIGG